MRCRKPMSSRAKGLALGAAMASLATTAPAMAQAPPMTPDDFVAAAGGADQYEMMAAQVALVQSHDAGVRAFAQEMMRDHAASAAALSGAAMRSGLKPPPTTVGGDQAPLLAALQGLHGSDFDRGYIRQQILAHRYALTLQGDYARAGVDANLRGAARSAVTTIERHLEEAQRLRPPPER